MTMRVPRLSSNRLTVRELCLEDLDDVHRVLTRAWNLPPEGDVEAALRHEQWLRWTIQSYDELERLLQPPYGDRAVTLNGSGAIVGLVGFVPSLGPFSRLSGFPGHHKDGGRHPEVGLYWAIDPAHQSMGLATEAGGLLVQFAFQSLNLAHIIATTTYDNLASIGVMRKLGMTILRNDEGEPPWLQVLGVLSAT